MYLKVCYWVLVRTVSSTDVIMKLKRLNQVNIIKIGKLTI